MEKLIGRSKVFFRKNASTILTCVGSAGVVATAVMAVKATPKALRLIEAAEEEKGEKLTRLETIRVAGMTYAPAAAVGIATIGCILGANVLNKRTQAALTSAYALLDQSYKDYKKKVEELYGEEADRNVREEIAKDNYTNEAATMDADKILFYDEFSNQYFHSTMPDILKAEIEINKILAECCALYLNDAYEILGVPTTDYGDHLNWSAPDMYEMYWSSWLSLNTEKFTFDDGLECHILTFGVEPIYDMENYW